MKSRLVLPLLLLAFLAACASGGTGETPGTSNRPPMGIRMTGALFFGSSYSAPVSLEVTIQNDKPEPIEVWRITVQDAGMVQFSIPPLSRDFRTRIAPGESQVFNITAEAVTNRARLTPNEPLMMRVTLDGKMGEKRFRSLYLREPVQ